jgi:hypothetical protein
MLTVTPPTLRSTVSRIKIVKPEKARAVENMLIQVSALKWPPPFHRATVHFYMTKCVKVSRAKAKVKIMDQSQARRVGMV